MENLSQIKKSNFLLIGHPFSFHLSSHNFHRWDFPLALFTSSGVYSPKSKQQTHSSEAWVVQRCVWCSFIVTAMAGASEWEWSKVRDSVWWIWRRLTPPCLRQWESCWSWETRVWSVHRGNKQKSAFLHSVLSSPVCSDSTVVPISPYSCVMLFSFPNPCLPSLSNLPYSLFLFLLPKFSSWLIVLNLHPVLV